MLTVKVKVSVAHLQVTWIPHGRFLNIRHDLFSVFTSQFRDIIDYLWYPVWRPFTGLQSLSQDDRKKHSRSQNSVNIGTLNYVLRRHFILVADYQVWSNPSLGSNFMETSTPDRYFTKVIFLCIGNLSSGKSFDKRRNFGGNVLTNGEKD